MPHVTSNPKENQIIITCPIPADNPIPVPDPDGTLPCCCQFPVPDSERHYWPLVAENYFRLRFLVTRCYDGDFQYCWSWMARLAIIASRRRSGWHVVMHAVDVRSAAVLSAKDSCQRRASWRKRVRQWSVAYGQWYQRSNYQKKQRRGVCWSVCDQERRKRRFLPS